MKTKGEIIASNLKACDIISARDVERVAKQIDAGVSNHEGFAANLPVQIQLNSDGTWIPLN